MRKPDLSRLLKPRSIAVIGASAKPSVGQSILNSLSALGFQGAVYPVNPSYAEISGYRCYPGVAELPDNVDLAAFCIGNPRLMETYTGLARKGLGAAVVYAGGFGEAKDPASQKLNSELIRSSLEYGIALCGPNCMGVLSPATRSSAYMNQIHDPSALTGHVGLISQSGSIGSAIVSDCRRFGFSHIISSGNEAVVSSCDYLEWLIEDPVTRVIAMFIESVREPGRLTGLLNRAADSGKPVVVLKAGQSERAQRAILSHTGGLAGQARVFSALLRNHRAIEVDSLDELCEVLAACQGKHWPNGGRIGIVTGSGGQAELLLDQAGAASIDLPALDSLERGQVEQLIGALSGDGNPLDAWGNGDFVRNYERALSLFGASARYDAVVLCVDGTDTQPLNNPGRGVHFASILADAAARFPKPFYCMSTRSGLFRSDVLNTLRDAGVALVSGVTQGLRAIDRLGQWAMPQAPMRAEPRARLLQSFDPRRPTLHEFDAKRCLATFGLRIGPETVAQTLDEGLAAAESIGYPVALKALSDEIPHKSDLDLVRIGLRDEAEFQSAWSQLEARYSTLAEPKPKLAGWLVQQMAKRGVELLVGVVRDPDFGLVISVGPGGTLVDLLGGGTLSILPLRNGQARAMLEEQPRLWKLLHGVRGTPACNLESLCDGIEAIADFAWAFRDCVAEIDVNPLIANASGYTVVDALIIPLLPQDTGPKTVGTARP